MSSSPYKSIFIATRRYLHKNRGHIGEVYIMMSEDRRMVRLYSYDRRSCRLYGQRSDKDYTFMKVSHEGEREMFFRILME